MIFQCNEYLTLKELNKIKVKLMFVMFEVQRVLRLV